MNSIVEKSEKYITEKLTRETTSELLYHNLRHTQRVVNSIGELVEAGNVNDEGNKALFVAAWFHDVGYTVARDEHEEKSCDIAKDFLSRENCSDDFIDSVLALIRATKRDYEPQNEMEKMMKDADSSHLAKKSFLTSSELLRTELSSLGIAHYSIDEWRKENIRFLNNSHRFYTDYALENWQSGKDDNLNKLIKSKEKNKKLEKKESLKAKFKGELPDRGIQTLYRVTLRNHIKLSDIADTKANILLSVNAIVISLALANLIPILDNPNNDYLIYPTAVFVIFSVVSMVMSILATKPNVTSGQFTEEEVNTKKVNLLFFGNFHKMELSQYQWAMKELIKDKEYIYSSLTKDLYFLGIVLERKYRLLRWTYTVFMIGIILSVVLFAVALKFYGPEKVLELPDLPQ